MPTEKPRFTIVVDDKLLKRIDDFQFGYRYRSRSAATIELIRLGLDELERRDKEAKADPLKSIKEKVRASMEGEKEDSAQK